MRRGLTLLAAVMLVVSLATPVATAAAAPAAVTPQNGVDSHSDASTANDTESAETVGCWEGICHDTELDIDQSDGLTEDELQQLVHRSMARVEYLRDRPFKQEVPVETMTREEYQQMVTEGDSDPEYERWNDQVWKALFLVSENESSEEAMQGVFSGAVAGFYSPAEERIVIVVGEGEDLQVSGTTLVHELGHAMQDQYHDLTDPEYHGATQDEDLAVDGIVEGEAAYLEQQYEERCTADEWDCVGDPDGGDSAGISPGFNWGLYLIVFHPYSDGPAYTADVVDAEGWDGVAERMENPPESTSQVIHRDDRQVRDVEFEDTAVNGWETYEEQGVDGAQTVGEASMFTMFWFQNREYDADTFDWQQVFLDTRHPDEVYNYAHESTDGWAGDELYPYRNDADGDERDGYVWVTEWRTAEDAAEFRETYLRMLAAHDAGHRDDGVHYVEDGPFNGAYGVERNDTTVSIVHGPEPDDVLNIRPNIDLEDPADSKGESPTDAESDREAPIDLDPNREASTDDDPNREASADDDPNRGTSTRDDTLGVGVLATLTAVVVAVLLARRR